MKPSVGDHIKAHSIRLMRRSHLRTLEGTSKTTYRKRQVPTAPAPRLTPAARRYKGMGWLPTSLVAPEVMPPEAKLPNKYYLPYYATSKIGWMAYGRSQINPDLPWSPDLPWNSFFPDAPRGWGSPSSDEAFTALRLQGPNPFMLRTVPADPDRGEGADDTIFSLDFSQRYAGIFAPTEARFTLVDGELTPTSVTIDGNVHTPGDPGWTDAKRVVNSLDARESVFIRHLLNVHLMVGQAYALAAYSLPIWHPLRAFMDFFTYGTLVVNDAAYQALLRPDSYFLRSNFVTAPDARRMIENAMTGFDFNEWVWPKDRAARGLDAITDHPYVQDADLLWPVFETMVAGHLDDLDITDDEVRTDVHLARWYDTLCDVLPGSESIPKLTSRAELIEIMTALLWNNVIHEVCGNLSPILDSRDPADLAGINFDHLRSLIDPNRETLEPRAADVLLMDQATYVSRFNVAGNNLMEIPAARFVDDPRLLSAIQKLQLELGRVDQQLAERNLERAIPFLNLQPRKFEASISF